MAVEVTQDYCTHRHAVYLAKWAYPLKVLYLPAFVIDVLTYPAQVYWVLSQISDQ